MLFLSLRHTDMYVHFVITVVHLCLYIWGYVLYFNFFKIIIKIKGDKLRKYVTKRLAVPVQYVMNKYQGKEGTKRRELVTILAQE